jgi:capsular exopolysaccharide synthesis family protein
LATQQNAYASLMSTYLSVQGLKTQLLEVTVAESAVPPAKPIGLSPLYYAVIGALAGFSSAVGVVVLLKYLDRSFETDADVSRVLSLPTLGTIPQLKGKERSSPLSLALAEPPLAISEAYRVLRTNIRFASPDRSLKALLITSAEPLAGKSTVASNLAIVCAQGGLRVVIVDADLRRPNQHRLFGVDNRAGLTDLLAGDVTDVEECMLETGIDGLRLIPSGYVPPNPSELLGSNKMEVVLERIKEQADLVILDSPPALAVTDPVVLGPRVDGAILTVMAKRTSQDVASRAYEALTKVGTTVLGAVLVGTKRESGTYYYYPTKKQPLKRAKWKPSTWIARLQSR